MFTINPLVVRKATLSVSAMGTNIVTTVAIQKLIEKFVPQLAFHPLEVLDCVNDDPDTFGFDTKKLIKYYAKAVGMTLAISLVAAAITTLVTGKIDAALFPNMESGTIVYDN